MNLNKNGMFLYLQKIKSVQAEGPYRLAGYSFGATVAYEMALQLQAQQVEAILLFDGSPAYIAAQVEGHVNRMESCTKEELDCIFLCGFVVQIVSSDYKKVSYLYFYYRIMTVILSENGNKEYYNKWRKYTSTTGGIPVEYLKVSVKYLCSSCSRT